MDGGRGDPRATNARAIVERLAGGPVGALVCSRDGVISCASEGAAAFLGAIASDLYGHKLTDFFGSEAADALAAGKTDPLLRQIKRRDGGLSWVLAVSRWNATTLDVFLIGADAFAREREALAYRESIWRYAVEAAGHGVWDYNAKNEGQFYSEGWKTMRGFAADEEVDDSYEKWSARLHPDDRDEALEHVRKHNEGEVSKFEFEYRERRKDGNWLWILARGKAVAWDAEGKPTRLLGTDIDISALKEEEARRERETEETYRRHLAELEAARLQADAARCAADNLARQDPLTGLGNRRAFGETIAAMAGSGQPFAVTIVDLDRFKSVNDVHGHETGDAVLRISAVRLNNAAGDAMVMRLGGDEFGVLMRGESHRLREKVERTAHAMIAALREPIQTGGLLVEIGGSCGTALHPEHGGNYQSLMRSADMALYVSKQSNRGGCTLYCQAMGDAADRRARLEADLRQAIAAEAIEPFFQPIMAAAGGGIAKFEVLARWKHAVHGMVPPNTFIALAEQIGLLPQLTKQLLRRACLAARAWPSEVTLSLNLSAHEVCDLGTPMRLLNAMSQCRFPPSRLEVEVTEQALIKDKVAAKQVIEAFRRAGVRVFLDDFGAGYAGLGYLRELAFDGIKLDRSCIAAISQAPAGIRFAAAVQMMAKMLNLETVAEGIEDDATWDAVRSIGCSFGQGYLFSPAVPESEAALLVGTEEMRKSA
jgi:diguanylate cyclase (GGDEF)-like protein/PAS domain S-box-containing protein